MPKLLKYANVISVFLPDFDEVHYYLFTKEARNTAKLIKLPMDTPITLESYFTFSINSFDEAIKKMERSKDEENKVNQKDAIDLLRSLRNLTSNNQKVFIVDLEKKGFTGRAAVVEMNKNDVNLQKIFQSPYVNTIGDLLVAITALTFVNAAQ